MTIVGTGGQTEAEAEKWIAVYQLRPNPIMTEPKSLFELLAKLAEKDGVAPINKLTGCWERQIGDYWVAINGHRDPRGFSRGSEMVQPFQCFVEWKGWPSGIFSPFEGTFVAGIRANEEDFARAIEHELTL